jgi:hypothetical protein
MSKGHASLNSFVGCQPNTSIRLGLSALALVLAQPLTAMAQSALQQGSDTQPSGARLEEVVVTAQRKTEDLQKVPISATAFSADDIAANNIQSMQDVVNRTPNVSFITSGSRERDSISIRGLSDFTDPNNLATIRANTFGFYIDEFNVASATSNPGVVDMDRIRNRLCDRHGTLGRTRHGAEPAARQPSQRRPWRAANDPHVPRRSDIGGL